MDCWILWVQGLMDCWIYGLMGETGNGSFSKGPTAMLRQGCLDGLEQVQGGELQVGDTGGPVGFETKVLVVLEPKGDLFDGGLFEVGGKLKVEG
jgi:hypothetical protein